MSIFSCSGQILVSIALIKFAWKKTEKILKLFLITLVDMSWHWVAFEAFNASIFSQISSIITNLKGKICKFAL